VSEVGILIVDDDLANQQALKLVLDSEGWRVRILAQPSQAMAELATGMWDLAIVNAALLDMSGPIFATLKELAQANIATSGHTTSDSVEPPRGKQFRVLFLVPLMGSKEVPLILEREGLPYAFKPYHLHDFLQKAGDLLLESGAIAQPIRGMESFARKKRRRDPHSSQAGKKMFASREDYQMTEEEMAEYERQEREEEEERKKRAKPAFNREPL
jgi:DNA-binding response OmpR family regulator